MATLPYITAHGNIERALVAIKVAATPDRVTQDFVKTILKIPGGSGDQVTAYLRKIGFVNTDGTPSAIYKKFRNPSTAGHAAAEALKIGYAPLYRRNEFMHALSDDQLKGIVVEETGSSSGSSVPDMVVNCIKAVKKHAKFDGKRDSEKDDDSAEKTGLKGELAKPGPQQRPRGLGMNLSYMINLNLPATADIAVFNAIFKSLKENLLTDADET